MSDCQLDICMSKRKNIPTRWTPRLIKQLQGNRSLAGFRTLVGATRNTVGQWNLLESVECTARQLADYELHTNQ